MSNPRVPELTIGEVREWLTTRGQQLIDIAATLGDSPIMVKVEVERPPVTLTSVCSDLEADIDKAAVATFADAMLEKLAASRAKGRSGWHDASLCPMDRLVAELQQHLDRQSAFENPNLLDIATLSMMIYLRQEKAQQMLEPLSESLIREDRGNAPSES